FQAVEKDALPRKVWGECLDCPKFPDCDEVAMEMRL
ncbi:MAG: GNAT family N-acetyltransferase, partial [Anaerolineae bacterium]|nr:GNAT family N-acetyltransferase [Anaerolineae bacterium]